MARRKVIARTAAMVLAAAAAMLSFASASAKAHAAGLGPGTIPVGPCDPTSCVSTIAFTSTRDNPTANPPLLAAEIYLMNPDGTDARRLTNNAYGDAFPTLSPDGKKIVFDSNRLTAGTACGGVTYNNVDDVFLMESDGSGQTLLTRGSSATWSPDSKNIAFHASASYYASAGLVSGCPIRTDPGSATSDSDIFVANVDDLLAGVEQARNITNSPDMIDDDVDWSPDGQKLVFTSHPVWDATRDSSHAELYLMNTDGTDLQPLTANGYEERAPAWSPDGSRIVYSCRVGPINQLGIKSFRICVINADGTTPADCQSVVSLDDPACQLTNEADSISDLTASWSPDGQQILFHRQVPPDGQQLFVMTENPDGTWTMPAQLTYPPGINNLAQWGEVRLMGPNATP